MNAGEVARSVGRESGLKAAVAHLMERMFSNNPNLTVLGTTIKMNPEESFIVARVHCLLHL